MSQIEKTYHPSKEASYALHRAPLVGRPFFFSVLAAACQFGTARAGLRLVHHHHRKKRRPNKIYVFHIKLSRNVVHAVLVRAEVLAQAPLAVTFRRLWLSWARIAWPARGAEARSVRGTEGGGG